MPRISDEKLHLIEKLHAQKLSSKEIVEETSVSFHTVWAYTKLREKTNPETGELYESQNQYMASLAKQRINPETGELYESLDQYIKYRAKQRVKKPENKALSGLIKRRLKELGKNQTWLSKRMGVSREAVSRYVQGESIPHKKPLKRLYSALKVPYKTIDDLLEDIV